MKENIILKAIKKLKKFSGLVIKVYTNHLYLPTIDKFICLTFFSVRLRRSPGLIDLTLDCKHGRLQ